MAAPFPLEAARHGEYVPIAAWIQSGGGAIDQPFKFEDWNPLQLLAAEGNKAGVDCEMKRIEWVPPPTEVSVQRVSLS